MSSRGARSRAVAAAFAVLSALALTSPRARAEPAVVVIVATAADPFARRVQAELEAIGLRALTVEPSAGGISRVTLEAAARGAHAIAAIGAVPAGADIEIWIADRITQKTVLRQVSAEGESAALRVVELLRASILESTLPEAPRGEVAVTAEIQEKLLAPTPMPTSTGDGATPPTFRVSLAPGILGSPGGFAPAASIDGTISWMPSDHFGVAAVGVFQLTRPSVGSDVTSANLSGLIVGVGARFVPCSRASVWAPSVDLGISAAVFTSTGTTSSAAFTATSVTSTAPAPYLRAGVAYGITPGFRVRVDAMAALLIPAIEVQFAGKTMATWGRPILGGSLGVDFGTF